jgi:hypothetical protein
MGAWITLCPMEAGTRVDFDATNKVCLDGFPGGHSHLWGFQGTGTFAAAKMRHLICDGTVR